MTTAVRLAARVWWYAVVPMTLAALTLRAVTGEGRDGAVARLVYEQPVVAAAVAFLVASALVRYWSFALPGARAIEAPARPARRRTALVVLAVGVAAAAGIAAGRAFQPARIVSTSMVPTILPGDRVWVDKRAYGPGRDPRPGDVVVFHHARAADGDPGALAKRVIAVPGDHVAMNGSHPVINGREVASCDAGALMYIGASQVSRGRLTVEWLDGRAYLTVHEPGPHAFTGYDVKPGEVFVLGDNRGVSNDSRSWRAAGVPFAEIAGRVDRVLFGEDRGGRLDGDRAWLSLGTELRLAGVDLAPLRAGLERCLRAPPSP